VAGSAAQPTPAHRSGVERCDAQRARVRRLAAQQRIHAGGLTSAWTENCDGKPGGAAVAIRNSRRKFLNLATIHENGARQDLRFRADSPRPFRLRVYSTPQQRARPRRYDTSRPQAAISQFDGDGACQIFDGDGACQITVFSFEAAAPQRQASRRSSTGPYKFLQCPLCQTQRRPVQRQRPDTQRGRLQPRGGGGLLSALAGGIGGRRGCATAVLSGATNVARHAFSSALRLRIHPTSGQLE